MPEPDYAKAEPGAPKDETAERDEQAFQNLRRDTTRFLRGSSPEMAPG